MSDGKNKYKFGPSVTFYTCVCRAVFADVATPRAYKEGDAPKFSLRMIHPLGLEKEVERLKKAVNEAFELGNKDLWKGKAILAAMSMPFKDGNEYGEKLRDEGKKETTIELYKDKMIIDSSSSEKFQPFVYDRHKDASGKNVAFPPEGIYDGCFVKCSLAFQAYEVGVNKGVTARLNGIQFIQDGPRLDRPEVTFEEYQESTEDSWMNTVSGGGEDFDGFHANEEPVAQGDVV